MSADVEVEPIPGLPHELPPGERILWQGGPQWRGLAKHTFQIGWLGAYFAVFTIARGVLALRDGHGVGGALLAMGMVLPLAALCLGILCLLSWLNARATIYTITTKRVVMRFGVALPMSFNLPFKRLASADLKVRSGGEGDIALELAGPDRLAYAHLWPHARPWRFSKAQPMLRSIADAARVAGILGDAVKSWSAASDAPVMVSEVEAAPAAEADGQRQPDAAPQVGLGPTLATQTGR